MKRAVFFLFITCISFALRAQLSMSNQGALVSLKNGAFISVHGDYRSDINGSFDNEDTVFVFGDWENNAGNTGFNEPNEGTVVFLGDDQRIKGTDITHYYNLDHRATGIKFGDLDVIVEGVMQLNDREFNMDTHTVTVTNPDVAAVLNTTGFVSSLQNGGLARHTNSAAEYFYPVGSSIGTLRYRPAYITPTTSAAHNFKTRMANVDATAEAFSRNVRQPVICEINPYFYHRIFRMAGADAADILLTYLPQDGQYGNMVHWQNIPWWEDMGAATTGSQAGFNSVEINAWNDYSYSPFALANTSPNFDVNNDHTLICDNDTVVLFIDEDFLGYQFFINGVPVQNDTSRRLVISTLNDGDTITVVGQDSTCIAYSNQLIVDVFPLPTAYPGEDTTVYIGAPVQLHGEGGVDYLWLGSDTALTCLTCQDPVATVFETTPFGLVVSDANGCKDIDTVVVIIDREIDPRDVLFIPNAITPNGDGVNEQWNIRNLELYPNNQITVLNRWGDVIYDATPYLNAWDGTYKGNSVPDGTYYYLIKLKDVGQTLNGPLTVVR